jgi:exosortase
MPLSSLIKGPIIAAVLLAGMLGLLYREIIVHLGEQWYNDPDYSHGFLVPVIAAYLLWERRGKLAGMPIVPSPLGISVLGSGLMMLVVGTVGAELFLQRSSLIVVIAGLVLLLCGRACLRVVALPVAFLLFMVPFPAIVMNAVAFPLQVFSAQFAELCLFNLGIPVLREGNVIALAGTTLEVAEACSGIRSLQALLALGTIFAYFSQRAAWKRWLLVLLSVPIAIAANAFRVAGTGVLAHQFGPEAAEGFYHTFSGLAVFGAAFVLLLLSGAILSRTGREKRTLPHLSSPYKGEGKSAVLGKEGKVL